MRYLKILGLLAVATAALMAFAGPASATTVTTSTGGASATPTIHAVNENGNVLFHNPEANIECSSTFQGPVESHGSGITVTLKINAEFKACINGWSVTVNVSGTLHFHWNFGHGAKVTWTGGTITATLNLVFFHITCRYATAAGGTDIGTLTGGNPATLHLEGKIPFHSGSAACGEEPSQWTGDYTTTSALYVAP
jgi:hypothetical protein